MANENRPNVATNTFTKQMVKDMTDTFAGEGCWSHARNAVKNSHDGELGALGNEPANLACVKLPYTHIGSIHLIGDRWAVFSTDDINSEIGIFDESECSYTKTVNDPCLGFRRSHLITGVSKMNFDCTWSVYFSDGINPDRTLNLDRVPYKKIGESQDDCKVPVYSKELDCEALRLARLISLPEIELRLGHGSGTLPNGSYQVVTAFTVNGIRVTDYSTPSNVQSVFSHENLSGALELEIHSMDTNFDEFELVLISVVNQQTRAQRMGVYSTRQTTVFIDQINNTLPVINLDLIPLQSPAYERSDAMYEVNNYLIRTGIYTKFDFNYQPLANKIRTKWVAVEYPADYYVKGGNKTSYMRDEVYPFFIRWVYNTGEKSASYHIPGRVAQQSDLAVINTKDSLESKEGTEMSLNWMVNNTATVSSMNTYQLPDGGNVIREGEMAYWESAEKYPTNQREIWDQLCGKNIRHHKFTDNNIINHHSNGGDKIVVLGIRFEGIEAPVDNDGKRIESIVGYEILRGSRDGNRSIIAKGIINNMGEYEVPDGSRKGLYANYPYNDLRLDPFLSKKPVRGGCAGKDYEPMGSFRDDVFTFHSPETGFRNPFLSAYELKVYGELSGSVIGNYEKVDKHPRVKLVRDFALLLSAVVGIGDALFKMKGKKTVVQNGPKSMNVGIYGGGVSVGLTGGGGWMIGTAPIGGPVITGYYATTSILDMVGKYTGIGALASVFGLGDLGGTIKNLAGSMIGATPGAVGSSIDVYKESTPFSEIPGPAQLLGGPVTFGFYFAQSTDALLKVIKAVSNYQQYAYQFNSHGFYHTFKSTPQGNTRRKIVKSNYIEQHLQDFGTQYRINNLFRPRTVALELDDPLARPATADDTRKTIGDLSQWSNPEKPFVSTTSAYYAALKVHLRSQYGQLENINQVPVSTSVHAAPGVKKAQSPVLFGGDIYINRFTEKNTFFFFNSWMHDLPDGFEFDYRLKYNVPYPRYWMDSQEYDASQLTSAIMTFDFKQDVLPNDLAHLDRKSSDCNSRVSFIIKQAYFYLFCSGVRDFFVESEVNLAHRDFGERDSQKHYDPNSFTDLSTLFRSDIIKSNNYYKYDYSLSIGKLYQNLISWGQILPRDYDPKVAATCHTYYPNRAIYSLPQQTELKKDNWIAFLANNYKDFPAKITSVKSINKTGALIMMENQSPMMFNGIDSLETAAGVKLTVGDGGLFNQPLQNLANADVSYEYGSSDNKHSVIGTPQGVFWTSAAQGKIFHHGGSLSEISREGNKWWFARYMPYQLLKDFPQFELKDNPVIGIGMQASYDNTNEVVYFSKKDYKLRDEYKGQLTYYKEDRFIYNGAIITLGDPLFFENASWTVSYDPASKGWVSFHDWHPDLTLPGKTHFMTVKDGQIWKHNARTDLFCNFYGKDYPFEIEFISSTGQNVNTVRSVEYMLECYKYLDGTDRFHVLDENFDRAVVHNSEQTSGLLKLHPAPKNNPVAKLQYPKVSNNGIDILFSKEENKYRFNQFWDATRDRGEVSGKEVALWDTSANGYDKQPNGKAVNYQKSPLQRKKFRHYSNRIFLKKSKCDNIKFLFKLFNTKNNPSSR